MKRDLYSLLGLESDASMDLIESAYRELVSQLYPDLLEHDRDIFLRRRKAYSTLADEWRRKPSDEALLGGEKPLYLTPHTPVESVPREKPVDLGEVSLTHSFRKIRPSFEQLLDPLSSNFTLPTRQTHDRAHIRLGSALVQITAQKREKIETFVSLV